MALLVFEVAFGVSYVCNESPLGLFWFSGVLARWLPCLLAWWYRGVVSWFHGVVVLASFVRGVGGI